MNENVIVCMYVGERVIPILYVFRDLVITHVLLHHYMEDANDLKPPV